LLLLLVILDADITLNWIFRLPSLKTRRPTGFVVTIPAVLQSLVLARMSFKFSHDAFFCLLSLLAS
jgi:hypothetical protein